ncbi:MAG: hypothetical protein CMJ36_02645 [Phycisphaerae bacterium]|nr:hypothetical protein [Phycisphaerae bacterium]
MIIGNKAEVGNPFGTSRTIDRMRILIQQPGRRATSLDVDPQRRPTRVRTAEDDRDVYLDWDQALDDEGRLRHCLVCGKGIYKRKAFPQVTGFVVVLAFALALVGLLGFADDIPLLIGMTVVLLIDVGILLFAGTHLECYGCHASYRSIPIAPWHRPWDRNEAARHADDRGEA